MDVLGERPTATAIDGGIETEVPAATPAATPALAVPANTAVDPVHAADNSTPTEFDTAPPLPTTSRSSAEPSSESIII